MKNRVDGHSCPLLLTLLLTLPLSPELRANCPARSDGDPVGQFVGKRVGSDAVVAQEGAKRRPARGADTLVRCF
jgi:hypothetical protein